MYFKTFWEVAAWASPDTRGVHGPCRTLCSLGGVDITSALKRLTYQHRLNIAMENLRGVFTQPHSHYLPASPSPFRPLCAEMCHVLPWK